MCTLTIVPTEGGYLAAMNRDELRSRPIALPHLVIAYGCTRFVSPREVSGGTWISCDERGDLLALLNWNIDRKPAKPAEPISRGTIIPRLMATAEAASFEGEIRKLALERYAPFRLVAVSLERRAISETRWNGAFLERLTSSWTRAHWFSSSVSDKNAAQRRGTTCEASAKEWPTGISWLRRLHRSHAPTAGAFSICVHRPDAATVSYSEVGVNQDQVAMRYLGGNPCQKESFDSEATLRLSRHARFALAS